MLPEIHTVGWEVVGTALIKYTYITSKIYVYVHSVGLCQFRPKGCAADVKPILLGKCLIYAMFTCTCVLCSKDHCTCHVICTSV